MPNIGKILLRMHVTISKARLISEHIFYIEQTAILSFKVTRKII